MLEFDWDSEKARANAAKHGVTFDEAATVFTDTAGLLLADPDHSTPDEDRWVLIGVSREARLLVVVHTDMDDATIRLISARRASRQETRQYFDRPR